jgi:hypothetical protein
VDTSARKTKPESQVRVLLSVQRQRCGQRPGGEHREPPGIFPRFRRHWFTSSVLGALRFIVNRGAVAKPRVQTHPVVVGEVAAQEAAHVAGAREGPTVLEEDS